MALGQVDATWTGGTGNWTNSTYWSNGAPPNNGGGTTYNVLLDGGNAMPSTVNLNMDASINSLTVDVDDILNIGNGSLLKIEGGTLTNDGHISINGLNSQTSLVLQNGTTIAGGGTITMNSSNLSRITTANDGDSIIIASGQTITGRGHVGANLATIQNNGHVMASGSGRLTLDPGTGGFSNQGSLGAESGGTLRLANGEFQNGPQGSLEALDGGLVEFFNAMVRGGQWTQAGNGSFSVVNGTTNRIGGTIQNQAHVMFNGANSATVIQVENSTSLGGSGSFRLGSTIYDRMEGATLGARLTNFADHTISGAGNLGGDSLFLINYGTIDASIAGRTLNVDLAANSIAQNYGTIQASGGGTLQIHDSIQNQSGGVIRANAGSTVRLMQDSRIIGGTLETTGDGIIEVANSQTARVSGMITNNGRIEVGGINGTTRLSMAGATSFSGSGVLELTSAIYSRLGGGFNNLAGHTIRGKGQIEADLLTRNYGIVEVSNTGTLTISGQNFQNYGLVTVGQGTLAITASMNGYKQFNASSTLRIEGGSVLNSNQLQIQVGTLEGFGTISGDVLLESATLRPGLNGAGILEIGSLNINRFTAVSEFEIGGLTAGIEHDLVDVAGSLQLHGELVLNMINGFESSVQASDVITIMSSSTLSGYFTNVASGGTLTTADGSGSFQVFYGPSSAYDVNSVVITNFTAVPEPASFVIVLLGMGTVAGTRLRARQS